MSVPTISGVVDASSASAPPVASPRASTGDDFAAALAAASDRPPGTPASSGTQPGAGRAAPTRDATQLASVTLGHMVAAYGQAGTAEPPALAGVPDEPGPTPVGAAATSGGVAVAARPDDPGGAGARVLAAGERYLGVPYRWGGTSPDTGFDCSGFVQRAFADVGVDLPRVSVDQAREGAPVESMSQARPGDLVFWHGAGGRPNHIGIYAGDGRMLVAPSTGDVVRYQEISREPDRIRRVI